MEKEQKERRENREKRGGWERRKRERERETINLEEKKTREVAIVTKDGALQV